jgi:hypothetical protein
LLRDDGLLFDLREMWTAAALPASRQRQSI